MAKSLSANSVANEFAAYNAVIILDGIGDKNTETETATTYVAFVPEACLSHLGELRTYVNNNWNSAKVFPNANDDAEKLSMVPALAASYEPKEPKAQTPLKRAVQNILCRMNASAVQGLSGAALTKAVAPDVERFLVSASLERYRSQIEAELVAIANETGKRSRRDGTSAAETGIGFTFETDENPND